MFDIEKFILEVKKRPMIWDPGNKHFYHNPHKRHAWRHVATSIFTNFKTYSPERKNQIVEDLRRKWKNLKDYWVKQSKRDYIFIRRANYLDLMNFIEPVVKSINYKHQKNNQEKKHQSKNNSRCNTTDIEVIDVLSDTTVSGDPVTSSKIVHYPEEDPDRSFLLSLLPDIRTMTEQQRFQFKLEIMNVINTLKYSNASSTNRTRNDIVVNCNTEKDGYKVILMSDNSNDNDD